MSGSNVRVVRDVLSAMAAYYSDMLCVCTVHCAERNCFFLHSVPYTRITGLNKYAVIALKTPLTTRTLEPGM
jgi:hypothetical protein